jgi:YggT family protein
VWVWIIIGVSSFLMSAASTGFRPSSMLWLAISISNFCRILSAAVLVRTLLSWFPVNPRNQAAGLLRDTTEPVLAPLRRVIPFIGSIDVTPLVSIVLLNLIPLLAGALVSFLG